MSEAFAHLRGIIDSASLSPNSLLRDLSPEQLEVLFTTLEVVSVPEGAAIVHEGEKKRDMFVILEGEAEVQRNGAKIGRLKVGDHFGEIGLIARRPRSATVRAITPVTVGRLPADDVDAFLQSVPEIAVPLMRNLIRTLGRELADVTDRMGAVLRERFVPYQTEVVLQLPDGERRAKPGTLAADLLPRSYQGHLTVAGLINRKAVSLNTPLSANAKLEPLTVAHWEGRRIFRRSAALLLLEAAHSLPDPVRIRMGPPIGLAQLLELPDGAEALPELATALEEGMQQLIAENRPFLLERWPVEDALRLLGEQGAAGAVHLLEGWRHASVPLVTLGSVYALSMGPLLPSTGLIEDVRVVQTDHALALSVKRSPPGDATAGARLRDAIHKATNTNRAHRAWLHPLAATSVGAFNQLCVKAKVPQVIRVAEGYHEKRLSQIADEVTSRRSSLRVICIAGPSSSGKTTFIKRLTVQLLVNGIKPVNVSLDDYYVDRDKTRKLPNGEYDFEAPEALDMQLLADHLGRLHDGEKLRLASYDFRRGLSLPDGGPEVSLAPDEILILEGIHALNPAVLGSAFDAHEVFRVFINPMTALPFDRLSRVSVSDVRLLRRIVRDRRHRNVDAAENIRRWPAVREGERVHIFPFLPKADAVFDSSLIYELSVIKVFADRYLLEVPRTHDSYTTAFRLRQLLDRFVTIYPDHVPATSILREFIGGSGFEY